MLASRGYSFVCMKTPDCCFLTCQISCRILWLEWTQECYKENLFKPCVFLIVCKFRVDILVFATKDIVTSRVYWGKKKTFLALYIGNTSDNFCFPNFCYLRLEMSRTFIRMAECKCWNSLKDWHGNCWYFLLFGNHKKTWIKVVINTGVLRNISFVLELL